jgi:type VI secretion system protein ImpA
MHGGDREEDINRAERLLSILDIHRFVSALSPEAPAGQDLDSNDDAEYQRFGMLCRGTPDQVTRIQDPDDPRQEIDHVVPGESPDPKVVLQKADALFARTHDLRLCIPLTLALTRLHGPAGLAEGLQIVAELLSNQWEYVHPQVSADYDFDVGYRARVLMGLADRDSVIRALRESSFAEARSVGHFTLRDLEVARGELAALDGQAAATADLIQAALRETGEDHARSLAQAFTSALGAIDRIEAAFTAVSAEGGLELAPLRKILAGAQTFLIGTTDAGGESTLAGTAEADIRSPAGNPISGRLTSRSDARRQLDAVAAFLERTEPAHPAAMFVRRAARLLEMDFLEIIKELAPDSLDGVRLLGGITDDK